jgi:hypothetical protein
MRRRPFARASLTGGNAAANYARALAAVAAAGSTRAARMTAVVAAITWARAVILAVDGIVTRVE